MLGIFGGQSDKHKAIELLIGAIVGVGMFGIPFAFVQSGFFVGMIYLVVIGFVTMTLSMMFAEVTIQMPGRHRMSGYVGKHFGKKWGFVAALVIVGSIWGGLVAYILVGGEFMHALLSPHIGGQLFTYQILFLAVGFLVSLRGLSFVTRIESYLVAALLTIIILIVVRGVFDVDVSNLSTITGSNIFLPYGVVLFSLAGVNVIPEIKDVLKKDPKIIRQVIPVGFAIIVALYATFAFVIVGVTGLETTPESIAGLGAALGPWVLIAGSLMGFLAVSTSFIVLSVELQDMFEFDFDISKLLAWFITMSAPLIIFLMGARDFIEVISFTGAVFVGLMGIFVVAMYLRVRKKLCTTPTKCFAIPKWISYSILVLFVTGILIAVLKVSPIMLIELFS